MGDEYDVHRDLKIPVSYTDSTKSGELTDLNVRVLVDDGDLTDDNIRISMGINHRCFLNCYVGIGKEMSGGKGAIMVHQNTCKVLSDYIRDHGGRTVLKYVMPAKHGEKSKRKTVPELYTCNYVSAFYRSIFKSIISFFSYLNKRNISIDGELIIGQNIYFKDNDIKFFQLKFVRTDAPSKKEIDSEKKAALAKDKMRAEFLRKCAAEAKCKRVADGKAKQAADFKKAAGVIKEIIGLKNIEKLDIPHDIKDLLQIMENFCDEKLRLIESHLAILSHADRIARIRNFFSKRVFMIQADLGKYLDAVAEMTRSTNNWTTKFNGRDLKMGPAQSCFDEHRLRSDVKPYVGSVENPKDKTTVNESLLRFCRNLAEHVSNHLKQHVETNYNFTEIDVELIVMTLFGDELLSFQREAHKSGALESLL